MQARLSKRGGGGASLKTAIIPTFISWSTSGAYSTVVDLGSNVKIKSAYINIGGHRGTQSKKYFRSILQGSTDNNNWSDLGIIENNTTEYISVGDKEIKNINTAYRYYRLKLITESSSYFAISGGYLVY